MHESRSLWKKYPSLAVMGQSDVTRRLHPMSVTLLDHGKVLLASDAPRDADLQISHAARVLEPWTEEWRGNDDVKLLEYMLRNKHTTPFEHLSFSFFIKAPIMVFRQWHRHRTQSYNEMSARYKALPPQWYTPDPDKIGVQHQKNHQSRVIDSLRGVPTSTPEQRQMTNLIYETNRDAFEAYTELLNLGCPREIARGVTSVFQYSEMYATANLLNWMRFLTLRMDEHAQYEIRVYANTIFEILRSLVPVTMHLFDLLQAEEREKERIYDMWCAGLLTDNTTKVTP